MIKDLSERLRTRMESGDPAVMLDAETLSLARNLGETLTRDYRKVPPVDFVEALSVLVAAHWARYQLLPEGRDQSDLEACLKWSAALLPIAPHLIPQPVRAYLADSDTSAGAGASQVAARADALRNDYQRTGNIQLLQNVITLLREAVDATPPGHPQRPRYLTSLGSALRTRYERLGQLADLDQVITVGRELVAAIPAGQPGRPGRCPVSGASCRSGSGTADNWRTWIRPSPFTRRPSPPPQPTTPTGPRRYPFSGSRCGPGSSARGSRRTWIRPSPCSGRRSPAPSPAILTGP